MSPANGLGGSRATILFSFSKAAAASALRALKQAGKKEGDILCQYPLHDKVNLFLVIVSLLMLQHHIDDINQFSL